MRKEILNDVGELGRVVCKIILQKYTSLWIDLSDVLAFTEYLGMDQIFTDYPTSCWEICEYRIHPATTSKLENNKEKYNTKVLPTFLVTTCKLTNNL